MGLSHGRAGQKIVDFGLKRWHMLMNGFVAQNITIVLLVMHPRVTTALSCDDPSDFIAPPTGLSQGIQLTCSDHIVLHLDPSIFWPTWRAIGATRYAFAKHILPG